MSYALAELEDGEGNDTREEVLQRILDFFDVTVSVEKPQHNREFHLSLFPNPASKTINIDFSVANRNDVSLEMYDLTGRLIFRNTASAVAGLNRVSHDVSSYHPGVYYLKLQAGEQVQTVKWIKVN
jgi:hypothetical protein